MTCYEYLLRMGRSLRQSSGQIVKHPRRRRAPLASLLLSLWVLGQLSIVGHQLSHCKLSLEKSPRAVGAVVDSHHQTASPGSTSGLKECELCQLLSGSSIDLPGLAIVALQFSYERALASAIDQETICCFKPTANHGRAPPFYV